jgi:hypothetical protein
LGILLFIATLVLALVFLIRVPNPVRAPTQEPAGIILDTGRTTVFKFYDDERVCYLAESRDSYAVALECGPD